MRRLFLILNFFASSNLWAAHIDAVDVNKKEVLVIASRDVDGTPQSFLSAYDVKTGKVTRTVKLPIDSRATGLATLTSDRVFIVHQDLTVPPSVAGFSIVDVKTCDEKAQVKTECEIYDKIDITAKEVSFHCLVDDATSEDLKPAVKKYPLTSALNMPPIKGFKPLANLAKAGGVKAELKGEYPWAQVEIAGKVLKPEVFLPK